MRIGIGAFAVAAVVAAFMPGAATSGPEPTVVPQSHSGSWCCFDMTVRVSYSRSAKTLTFTWSPAPVAASNGRFCLSHIEMDTELNDNGHPGFMGGTYMRKLDGCYTETSITVDRELDTSTTWDRYIQLQFVCRDYRSPFTYGDPCGAAKTFWWYSPRIKLHNTGDGKPTVDEETGATTGESVIDSREIAKKDLWGKVTIQGKATVYATEDGEVRTGPLTLAQGDAIRAGSSPATIVLGNGKGKLVLDKRAEIGTGCDYTHTSPCPRNTGIEVRRGRVWFLVVPGRRGHVYGTAGLSLEGGGQFTFETGKRGRNSWDRIRVYRGALRVHGSTYDGKKFRDWSAVVRAGQEIVDRIGSRTAAAPKPFTPETRPFWKR